MTMWLMRIAHTHTHTHTHAHTHTLRVCNNYCFSTATMVARTHVSVIRALPVLLVFFLAWLPYLYYKTIGCYVLEVWYLLGTCRRRHRGGVDVYLYSFFNLGARWRWVVRPTPRPIYPRGRATVAIVVSSTIDVCWNGYINLRCQGRMANTAFI